jgi:hypothetical protein
MPADQKQRVAGCEGCEHHGLQMSPAFQSEGTGEKRLRSLRTFGLRRGGRGRLF